MSLAFSDATASLVFEQDFSQIEEIDEDVWHFDDGPVYNNEVQVYTRKPAGNAWIENGRLIIEARKSGDLITSARLTTREAWRYGRFEVVARAPAGTGTWPAAWLLNDRYRSDRHGLRCDWPLCGEIDILEFAGSNPGEYHFTAHTAKYNHVLETQLTKIQSIREVDPEFHEFVLDWRPEVLTFYMDGQEVNRVEKSDPSFEAWPFDERYYLILNLAIGGGFGGRKGVDSEIFPSRYEIKSVRIYQ